MLNTCQADQFYSFIFELIHYIETLSNTYLVQQMGDKIFYNIAKFEKVGENWLKGRSMVTKDILIRLQF